MAKEKVERTSEEKDLREKMKESFKELMSYPEVFEGLPAEEQAVYQEIREFLQAKDKKGFSSWRVGTHIPKFAHSESDGSNILLEVSQTDSGYVETGSLKAILKDFLGSAGMAMMRSFLSSRFIDANGKEVTVFDCYSEAKRGERKLSPFFSYMFENCVMVLPGMRTFVFNPQVYFSAGGEDTLLVVMDSSSLYAEMKFRIKRLEEKEKQAARKLFFGDKLIRKTGGSNPANISHLNTLSAGVRYALCGAPPQIIERGAWQPLCVESFFRALERGLVRKKCENFVAFSVKHAGRPLNLELRQRRKPLLDEIMSVIFGEAEKLRDMQDDWSKKSRLPYEQCLWLNPYRGMEDKDFCVDMKEGKWQKAVSLQFALWLASFCNNMAKGSLVMGDPEVIGFAAKFLAKMEGV